MKGAGLSFLALLAVAGAFVLYTSSDLPPRVASHFDGTGAANGFMSRDGYVAFMVAMVVGVPTLIVGIHAVLRTVAPRWINIPNRDYWLAPERRADSVAFLGAHLLRFAWLLVLFLCFVHWRVVEANRLDPPRLSNEAFVPALIVFFILAGAWMLMLYRRFPKRR